jgi:DNA-damage-inducible protein J
MMSMARISVNVDGDVKNNAQKVLSEIGIDLTTAINLLLRTIIREERLPFDLRTDKSYREEQYRQYICEELAMSKIEASDPNTKWLTYEDVMRHLDQQRAARHAV